MMMYWRWGWVLASWLVTAHTAMAQTAPRPAGPQAFEVAPRTWMVQGLSALGSSANRNFISNAGFVVTSTGVVVIDALGSPELARELRAEIARVTPLPVTHVIVTHYHADHIYGLQIFKERGVEIIGHEAGRVYLNSDTAEQRLKASREELAPWIDGATRLVAADRWIAGPTTLRLGGVEFLLQPAGPAHTAEDLVVAMPSNGVLFAGDLVFRGRIPFVGQADSGRWIQALDRLLALKVTTIVPGHGPVSRQAAEDLQLTRDYLQHLRATMGEAARNLEPFDEAYAKADWSRFEHLPLFKAAIRINAYNTYLLMERNPP